LLRRICVSSASGTHFTRTIHLFAIINTKIYNARAVRGKSPESEAHCYEITMLQNDTKYATAALACIVMHASMQWEPQMSKQRGLPKAAKFAQKYDYWQSSGRTFHITRKVMTNPKLDQ
jgi:hypothetical protein